MVQHLNRWLRHVPVWAVWLLGLVPLGLLVWDALQGHLGVDPVRDIEHRLGRTAIYFLLATLTVTPLLRLTRLNLMRFRQALGLICFAYVACHLVAWVVFDMAFLWAQMLKDVVKRPYLVFGMLAFAMLLALALTSNRFSIRRMGAGWRKLHRLVYPAAILAGVHWLWALKVWESWPLTILGTILLLLFLRLLRKWGWSGVFGVVRRAG
ncbi:sulfoxide reductase heme-binding subunit YedZ [Paracoccus denitrificans]|jgi:sulfoxide reductase heme-binding subunit YedZ|uniref:Protein-methionine-sulfoxide reductase heme-binding subunit MsrQ n=2 Tax=Paracoccus denitrificans TaxID=266 RepID=A1AY37_PARDP|nr:MULTISPECIES: protein-methionine-sulfoxide reductase heme-binding subunit MsrQ [Paracoccus]ABL68181.1 Ferric reductase domain protein transmembrane component, N-terminal domain [Paracoccus denitrificans PD1222]MBB4627782.1 sulfoxide reductase heme-binding subunit YedZ [Paracoccus denitrificans]MCU7428868.1 sulfoxide reductase heme-binding subunit YedZ [Paracoccus denitrificans]MDK8872553.1 protein-methionine-sulfoxide reductase heme-binding subunit MsrQ [Paracoccus sp. SSJ]QAR26293.1 sulfox